MGEDQTNIRGPIIMYKYQEWKQQWQKWKERLQLGGPDGEQDKKNSNSYYFYHLYF